MPVDFSRMTLVQRVTHFSCCFSSCTEFRILCQNQEEVERSKITSSGKSSPVHISMSYMEMFFSLERRNSCPSATRVSDDHMSVLTSANTTTTPLNLGATVRDWIGTRHYPPHPSVNSIGTGTKLRKCETELISSANTLQNLSIEKFTGSVLESHELAEVWVFQCRCTDLYSVGYVLSS